MRLSQQRWSAAIASVAKAPNPFCWRFNYSCVMKYSLGAKICSSLFWNCFWNPTTGIRFNLALQMSLKQRGLPEAWSSWVISTINDTINMTIWCHQQQQGKYNFEKKKKEKKLYQTAAPRATTMYCYYYYNSTTDMYNYVKSCLVIRSS